MLRPESCQAIALPPSANLPSNEVSCAFQASL
jgi:hypothetical protein